MSRLEKLYAKAKNSPTNLKFSELCTLAKAVGFEERKNSSGHSIYKHHSIEGGLIPFQPDKRDSSKSKPYQAKQLVNFIDDNHLIDGE